MISVATTMPGRGVEGSVEDSLITFDFSFPLTTGQQQVNQNATSMNEVSEERETNHESQNVPAEEGMGYKIY